MYYTFTKGYSKKIEKEYYSIQRSYYSRKTGEYEVLSNTFLNKEEYEKLKELFDKAEIRYHEFDNTKKEVH